MLVSGRVLIVFSMTEKITRCGKLKERAEGIDVTGERLLAVKTTRAYTLKTNMVHLKMGAL